jgi:drug/metabolite transporter (DMT)-like permease
MHTLVLGISAGLVAAALSAVSYLIARHHGTSAPEGSRRMLAEAHVLMGLASLPIAWWLWPAAPPPPRAWLPLVIGCAGWYIAGQAAIFSLLKRVDASRIAPLLGLKIAILAMIVSWGFGHPLSGGRWVAVALSIAAAAMLQRSSRPLPPRFLALVLVACVFFAISDLCIVGLIDALQTPGASPPGAAAPAIDRLRASGLAMALTYCACGLAAALALPWAGGGDLRGWTAAGQYAAAWMGGMVGLYVCFGLVGAVYGNILQSTRGIMAVGAGAVLARMGWHDLEQPVDRETLVRRVIAALLMTAAIAVYVIS